MKPSVSVTIMAHPTRAPMVASLRESLDRHCHVVWDTKGDRWDTGSRALQSYELGATHHLVLQDDAVPCKNLVAGVERLLGVIPDGCPMVLYTGVYSKFIHRMNVAYNMRPFPWMVTPGILWGVGILIPISDISGIMRFCKDRPEQNYDMRVSRFYELEKLCGCWAPIPSLVDHRDSPSLVPGRKGGRRAWKFLGVMGSALDVPLTSEHRKMDLKRTIND